MSSPAAAAAGGFRRVYDREAEGVWAAPGRANLIGEFTDYNDGFVLPFALPFVARAALARRDDDLVRVVSAQRPATGPGAPGAEASLRQLAPGGSDGWPAYVLGVAWAARDAAAGASAGIGGVDVYLDSDVPIGAGLSSSAAVECAVALALRDLYALPLHRRELAALARRAENEFVGVPTGAMDQMASLCCEAGSALFLDTRDLRTRQVPLDLAPAGLRLLVVNTGVAHALATSAYADRRRDCLRAAAELGVAALRDVRPDELDAALGRLSDPLARRRARHVVSEDGRVLEVVRLLESARPAEIGPVLTAGHRSLREDFEVTSPEQDLVVDAAVASGALGARMTGGGFGGAVLVLTEAAAAQGVERAVTEAFAARGLRPPEATAVVACRGASRLA